MQSAFYVSLSSQIALEKRMTTIAANVANANSAGYRATGVTFEAVLSRLRSTPTAYASAGKEFITTSSGEVQKTDNPFDLAVSGDAWFAIRTPSGIAYTRDGRFKMTETGDVQTLMGYPVLDAGNSPIVLDPTAGPPTVFRDGMINQGDRQLGAIGLFSFDAGAQLTRAENSSVVPSTPAIPVLQFTTNGIIQGYLENANVNPVQELTKLIATSRAFEQVNAMSDLLDTSQREAIKLITST